MESDLSEHLKELYNFVNSKKIPLGFYNEKTYVNSSNIHRGGVGRFALKPIEPGEIIAVLGGPIVCTKDYLKYWDFFNGRSGVQVTRDLYIEQSILGEFGRACINHSCESNVGFCGQIVIEAKRRIEIGEELVIDYGTFLDEDSMAIPDCKCGSLYCRKYITCKDWLSKKFQSKNKKYLAYHIQKRIKDGYDYDEEIRKCKKINFSRSKLFRRNRNPFSFFYLVIQRVIGNLIKK